MMASDVKVTTEVLWLGALVFALVDAVFLAAISRRFDKGLLRRLKWEVVGTLAVFFTALWGTLVSYYYWDPVYHYFFPASMRWLLPPLVGLLSGVVGLASWWFAVRLPGRGALAFCSLGGVWGIATHLWAAWRGLFVRPPMLQGASPVAGVTIALFEFIFYWCVCLSMAALLRSIWGKARRA